MKLILRRHKDDRVMIEFFHCIGITRFLACVAHEDCFDAEVIEKLEEENEVKVEMKLVEDDNDD